MKQLLEKAAEANQIALSLGAAEVKIIVSKDVSTEMSQRNEVVEKSQQSNSMSLSFSLLVDGTFSTHSISDTRTQALKQFLPRAIEATRYLEQDPNRGLPPLEDMGRADATLDLFDSTQRTPQERKSLLDSLEKVCLEEA